eukprot:3161407-Pyramimonas_sp.AAC.1
MDQSGAGRAGIFSQWTNRVEHQKRRARRLRGLRGAAGGADPRGFGEDVPHGGGDELALGRGAGRVGDGDPRLAGLALAPQ